MGQKCRRVVGRRQRGGTARELWQVVPERRKNHVVDRLGRASGALPGVPFQIGILDALAESSFRALVEVVPVAEGAFLNQARVRTAVRRGGRGAGENLTAGRRSGSNL